MYQSPVLYCSLFTVFIVNPAFSVVYAVVRQEYSVVWIFKVEGAPIFTYTREPDDNEIHNGCKTMLYYVRGALCKHTIMSFLYVSIQEK